MTDLTTRPTSEPLKILLIDDRRDAVVPIQKMLQMDQHQAATAADGSSGVAKAVELGPQIVLCDIGLPGAMDGYAVARALRAHPATADVYLVAVTGYGEDDDRTLAREAGFDYHLTKPISRDQLRELVASRPRFPL